MKALVLAAGFGSRMRPITDTTPKPMIPFFGIPPLAYAITRCELAMIGDIAINCHHLGSELTADVRTWQTQSSIHLSPESEILGTGGALVPLRGWLGSDSGLLIYNSDALSALNLQDVCQAHADATPYATMVLTRHPHGGKTPVWVEGHRVVQIGGVAPSEEATAHTFTGIHILSPEFIRQFEGKTGFLNIIDVYQKSLESQRYIMNVMYDGPWFDLGTPSDFLQAHAEGFRMGDQLLPWLSKFGAAHARCMFPEDDPRHQAIVAKQIGAHWALGHPSFWDSDPDIQLGGWAVFNDGCSTLGTCKVTNSVCLPGSELSSREPLLECIRYRHHDGQSFCLSGKAD